MITEMTRLKCENFDIPFQRENDADLLFKVQKIAGHTLSIIVSSAFSNSIMCLQIYAHTARL